MALAKRIITNRQRAIVEHFSATIPMTQRAIFEQQVLKGLKQQREHDQLEWTILECINAIEAMAKEDGSSG